MIEQGLGRRNVAQLVLDDPVTAATKRMPPAPLQLPPLGRVSMGGEQQRDVVMLIRVGDAEAHGNHVEE